MRTKRRVITVIKVKVVFEIDEGIDISTAVQEMDYTFESGDGFNVVDTEILDYEVTHQNNLN